MKKSHIYSSTLTSQLKSAGSKPFTPALLPKPLASTVQVHHCWPGCHDHSAVTLQSLSSKAGMERMTLSLPLLSETALVSLAFSRSFFNPCTVTSFYALIGGTLYSQPFPSSLPLTTFSSACSHSQLLFFLVPSFLSTSNDANKQFGNHLPNLFLGQMHESLSRTCYLIKISKKKSASSLILLFSPIQCI